MIKETGLRLSFLSNMTPEMLISCSRNAGIDKYFEQFISTDTIQTYKPGTLAYKLGVDKLNLKKEEILFGAFGGWDASGSKWFGYPTFWVNRAKAPLEQLDATPDAVGDTLIELANYAKNLINR